LTFRFGGKAARSAAVIDRRKEVVSPEQQAQLRRQRLVLTVAGSIAFSGLAILAYNYTAPFADPPSFAVSAQTTAVAVPRVVVAEAEKPAADPAEAAAEPVERVTLAPEPAAEAAPTPATVPAETAAVAEVDILESDDPRWGTAKTAAARTLSAAPAEGGELAYAAANPSAAALERTVVDDPTDDTETSAIPRSRPAVEADEPERPSSDVGRTASRTATIASAVNLRAKGAKGARVIGVIPRGATVGLVGCDGWCEVIYEGRRGFIYKSFLGGAGRSADASERPRKTTKTKIVPVQHNDIDHIGR
jgi:hypothetical protein